MNGFNSQYFNRNLLNSLKDTLRGMVTEAEAPATKKSKSVGMRFDGGSVSDTRSTADQATAQAKLKTAADALTAETVKTGRWDDESRWDRRDAAYVDPTTPEARVRRSVADGTSPASVLPSTKTPTNQSSQPSSPAQSARQAAAQNTRETETALRGVVGKGPVPPPVGSAVAALDNAKKENTYFGAGIAAEYKRRLDLYGGKAMPSAELDASEAQMDALQKTSADAIQVAAEAGGNKTLIDQATKAPRSGPATAVPTANPQTPIAPTAKPQAPVRAGGAAPATSIWQSSYMDDQKAPPAPTAPTTKPQAPAASPAAATSPPRPKAAWETYMDSQKAPPAPTASSSTPAVKPQTPVSIPAAEQRLNDNAVDIYTTARMQQLQVDNVKERKTESDRSFNAAQDRVAAKPQTVGAVPGTPSLASMNRAAAVATVGMPTAPATPTPPRESVNGRTYDALTDLQLQNIVRNTKTTKFGGEVLDDSKQKQTFIQARDELARRAKK